MLLMNPGPVTLSERVRRSMLQPDLCHRESEFFDLQDEARARLLATHALDPETWTAVLMTASGTAAIESMIAALVPETGRVLVVENGVYGERIGQICERYRITHQRVTASWRQEPQVEQIAELLDAAGPGARFTHVAMVHHETTTGRLNDLKAVSAVCARRGLQLLVDGVSSFGAEAIDFDDPCLAAVAATANKCLHGVPGAAFVVTRRAALKTAVSRTYYLDLKRLAELQDRRNTPFTPAVHVYYALVEALREYEEQGGRLARYAKYQTLAEQVRTGLRALGISPFLPVSSSSVVLRSYYLPKTIDYPTLHGTLKSCGFVVYAGQGDLSQVLFRISTMGEIDSSDIDRLIECFALWQPVDQQMAG